jgi:hypothetical protein
VTATAGTIQEMFSISKEILPDYGTFNLKHKDLK